MAQVSNASVFGAVCPARDTGAALVLPYAGAHEPVGVGIRPGKNLGNFREIGGARYRDNEPRHETS